MSTDVIIGKQCLGTAGFKLETDKLIAFLSEESQVHEVRCEGIRYCLEAKLFHPLLDSNKWEKIVTHTEVLRLQR